MSLEQWRRNDWLMAKPATLPEITQLLAVVDRELNDCDAKNLSIDGRFMHAYDAALTLCQVALRASGFCVNRKQHSHHKITIESLPLTLEPRFADVAALIVVASRKRSQALYDRVGVVESRDADDLAETARSLRSDILKWLVANHKQLLPRGIGP